MSDIFEKISQIIFTILAMIILILFTMYLATGLINTYTKKSEYTILTENNYCIEQINDKIYKLYQCNYIIEKQKLGNNNIYFKNTTQINKEINNE